MTYRATISTSGVKYQLFATQEEINIELEAIGEDRDKVIDDLLHMHARLRLEKLTEKDEKKNESNI